MLALPALPGSSRWGSRTPRQLSVWGLSESVELSERDGVYSIRSNHARDALLAEGYLAAHLAMASFDLERRLWSGRLAELLGEKSWAAGITAADLDPFIRLLGFRRRAELAFRKLAPERQADAEAYARGVNAWIDGGHWKTQPVWARLRSRPRFWAATDCLLIALAKEQVDSVGGPLLTVTEEAKAAGWTESWDQRIRTLWAALSDDALRAPGAVGAGHGFSLNSRDEQAAEPERVWAGSPSSFSPPESTDRRVPSIVRETVLEGGDNHRVQEAEGEFRRLRVLRPDIEVRGGATRRPWLRWSKRGGLVSDLLQDGLSTEAPAGPAFAWSWDGQAHSPPPHPHPAATHPRTPLPDDHPWRLLRTAKKPAQLLPLRLVPQVGRP